MTEPGRFAERFSLWMLGAMMCLPFLVPIHTMPRPSFYAEWMAGLLGLMAAPILLTTSRRPLRLPLVAAWPLVLVAILLLQVGFGDRPYREALLLAMLYLIWGLLLLAVAIRLKERFGIDAVTEYLAWWVAIGAIANATAGLLSAAGYGGPFLVPQIRAPLIFGNLAQQNHFADHLCLGLASTLHLMARRRITATTGLVICLLLLPAIAFSGSRSPLIYVSWLMIVGYTWKSPGSAARSLALLIALIFLIVLFARLDGIGETLALKRIATEYDAYGNAQGSGISTRITLFALSWAMFLDAPWLGSGFGSFAWNGFLTADRPDAWRGTAEHAHNLIAQMLGEMGIFALLATLACLIYWWRQLATRRTQTSGFWLAGVVGILLIHAMVEYPLSFAYFLGVLAVALALGDSRSVPLRLRTLPLATIVLAGFLAHTLLVRDHVLFQLLAQRHNNADSGTAVARQRAVALLGLRRGSLLKPEIDLFYSAVALPTQENLADKRTICELSLRYHPSTPNVFNCTLVFHLAGETARAEHLWRLSRIVFPGVTEHYRSDIEKILEEKDLVPLRPILSIAD